MAAGALLAPVLKALAIGLLVYALLALVRGERQAGRGAFFRVLLLAGTVGLLLLVVQVAPGVARGGQAVLRAALASPVLLAAVVVLALLALTRRA